MNFFEAINAHIAWKLKLQKYIDGVSEERLNPEIICQDNKCKLGQWIYGEGQVLKAQPLFQDCREKHAAFHQFAAEVVRKCDSGDKSEAQVMLDSQYRVLSRKIIKSLTQLHMDQKGADTP